MKGAINIADKTVSVVIRIGKAASVVINIAEKTLSVIILYPIYGYSLTYGYSRGSQ